MSRVAGAVPASALAIGAHPDDVELQAGGTLAKWAEAGCTVHLLVCTDGSRGTWDPHADRAELVVRRRHEQRAAAAVLGVRGEVAFLDWPDGELESGLVPRGQVAWWIRRLRPAVVLGHDPWKRYRLHPDHRHAGLLACEGIVAARDPHFFPEHGLAPHRPDRLLLFEPDEPTVAEDVTGYVDRKVDALLAHQSQQRSTMGIEPGDTGAQRDAFRAGLHAEAEARGREVGMGAAEVFAALDDL